MLSDVCGSAQSSVMTEKCMNFRDYLKGTHLAMFEFGGLFCHIKNMRGQSLQAAIPHYLPCIRETRQKYSMNFICFRETPPIESFETSLYLICWLSHSEALLWHAFSTLHLETSPFKGFDMASSNYRLSTNFNALDKVFVVGPLKFVYLWFFFFQIKFHLSKLLVLFQFWTIWK